MKQPNTMKKLLLIIPILLLSGCGEPTHSNNNDIQNQSPFGDIYVHEDSGRGVTCWVFFEERGYAGGGGIYCIPNSQLTNNQ